VLIAVIYITSAIEPSFHASHVVVVIGVLGRVADLGREDHFTKEELRNPYGLL